MRRTFHRSSNTIARLSIFGSVFLAGLAIAAGKAVLIILYFMHARYSNWLTWIVVAAGLLWLGILLVLTMSDYLTRIQM